MAEVLSTTGACRPVKDLCVFAHFDRDNLVDEYVLRYLKEIRRAGFELVFVTTSEISNECVARLERIPCIDVIRRQNVGHDFGSWSVALGKWRDCAAGRILLANDSVYGPIGGQFMNALDLLTSRQADVYGMVKSAEITPHLQSWFLLFEPNVVRSTLFEQIYMAPVRNINRASVIVESEVGGAEKLQKAGYRLVALFEPGKRRKVINPAVFLWRQLIERDKVPFLKISHLRDNPSGALPDSAWRPFLAQKDPELFKIATVHLDRVRRGVIIDPATVGRHVIRRIELDDMGARSGIPYAPLILSAVCGTMRILNTRRRRAARIGRSLNH